MQLTYRMVCKAAKEQGDLVNATMQHTQDRANANSFALPT